VDIIRFDKIEDILEKIDEWKSGCDRIVVAIDGYGGSGKSTLLRRIEKNRQVIGISLDDFVYEYPRRKSCMKKSATPELDLASCWYRFDDICHLISSYRAGDKQIAIKRYNFVKNRIEPKKTLNLNEDILIIEGIFTIGKLADRKLIDRSIIVLSDFTNSDNRRLSRERSRWGENYLNDDDEQSYARVFKSAFQYYMRNSQAISQADLLVLN
jgi:uridine kinase